MKKRLVPSVVAGFAVALYFVIVLPVQTYLACADASQYSLGDLLGEFWVYFVLAWVLVGAALFGLSYVPLAKATVDANGRRRRKISLQFHVFALALVIAAIVESGPMSIGLPELNGDFSGYRSIARTVFDLAVLLAIVVAPLACYRWIKRHVAWIAAAVAFYAAVSLLDVNKAKSVVDSESKMMLHDFTPRYDVVAESAFAPSNNVIVLVLDTLSTHAVREIFRSDPAFAEHFPGFVNYFNNLGMHWPTGVGLPGIMLGRCYENEADLATYGIAPFGTESFIKEYVENDMPVYLNVGIFPLGWTNRKPGADGRKIRQSARPSQITIEGTLELRIGDMALFRIVPYGLKERIVMMSAAGRDQKKIAKDKSPALGNINRDDIVWPLLAKRPVNASFRSSLHVHHSHGGHVPISHDENGNSVNIKDPTFGDYVSHCKYAMKQLAACLDAWRASGVYDASTIIVTSDHGVGNVWPETKPYLHDIPSPAFPALMVKAQGATGPYSEHATPTSHARIAPLVRALRTKALSADEMESMLFANERFCRATISGNIVDWNVTGDWSVQRTQHADVERDMSTLTTLKFDKTYRFVPNTPPEFYPDFVAENGSRAHTCGLGWQSLKNPIDLVFKAPSPKKPFDALLCVRFHDNPTGNVVKVIAKCGAAVDSFSNSVVRDLDNYLLLKGCKADKDGFTHIQLYYAGQTHVKMHLKTMHLARDISSNLCENGFFPAKVGDSVDLLRSWRVDAAFTGANGEKASISGAGENVTVDCPPGLLNNGRQGALIQGHAVSGECKLVCKGSGDIRFRLRSADRRSDAGRLALQTDFDSFKINGREMLGRPIQTTFDKVYEIPYHINDGEEIHLSMRILPHRYDYLAARQVLLDGARYTHQVEKSVDDCLCLPEMQEFLK